jgi:hypothetical protein
MGRQVALDVVDEPVRVLETSSPAGFEEFFDERSDFGGMDNRQRDYGRPYTAVELWARCRCPGVESRCERDLMHIDRGSFSIGMTRGCPN